MYSIRPTIQVGADGKAAVKWGVAAKSEAHTCVSCRWFVGERNDPVMAGIGRCGLRERTALDPITGATSKRIELCTYARDDGGSCGPQGDLWELR